MCGIAGIISKDPSKINKEGLKKMTDSMAHRGPDGEGFWMNTKNQVGFGHRRLSILDLSINAAQPMHFANRYSIVHNGEIYNYLEIKKELEKKGYSFRTNSDTEVILAAYDFYKEECLEYFEGMFAFAIWDENEKTVFCARDRFGEKPFFYSFDEEQFLFSSEIKALWAAGIPKKINNPLLLNYLAIGHSQTPVDKTISFYQEVYSLPPAHFLKFEFSSFSFQLKTYWDLNKERKIEINEQEAKDQLKELLFDSVNKRLRSDVSIGTSLSGGLDSSSISAIIHELGSNNFSHKTFSATFPGFEKDESTYIDLVSKKYGLENYKVTPTVDDFIKDFEKLCYHQEMPFSSSSVFAQYKVFELASNNNVKVLLDGQGADETLAGYPKYIHWYLQELFRKNPIAANSEKRKLKRNGIPFQWNFKNQLASFFPAQAANQLEKRETKKIRNQADIDPAFKLEYFDRPSIYKPLVTKLNDILYFDTCYLGLEELLQYADRNSMAHGRELRLPFLSHGLVEFIFSLPSNYKIKDGFTKWVLRKTMEPMLPNEIVWRKDKTGYEPPQRQWMENKNFQEYIRNAKQKLVDEKILKPTVMGKKIQPQDAYAAENVDMRYLIASYFINC